jgi:S-adenosylmethionine:tRNA ribosyltransferase-isomerase
VFASDFDFDLPDELIAQRPIEPRDCSRLMVVDRRRGRWEHRTFAELPELLDPRDVLARNNTRVVPARLVGRRETTGGKWEGLFLREQAGGTWEMLATTRGRPSLGEQVVVGHGLHLALEARGAAGSWIVRPCRDVEHQEEPTVALLERHGQTPLPPYIRRGRESPGDRLAYQTVYARWPGSVAAPTAGLHFTDQVFTHLDARGITWIDLTLHVGLGTFRPMEVQQLEDHVMHAEWAELSPQAVETLQARRRQGGRIVAIGTTSTRTLEAAAASGTLQPFSGETQLFIRPGHVFHAVDALITNFHLPRSSLLVLVSALAGLDLIRAAYAEAIRNHYRFFSYGDAMLIL